MFFYIRPFGIEDAEVDRIAKSSDGRSSRTLVQLLDENQRIEELSRMLGGLEITATTRAHAEEMIRQAAAS